MPEAREVICHGVRCSSNVGRLCTIPVMALVCSVETKEMGPWSKASGRSLSTPRKGCNIVREDVQCAFTNVCFMSQDVIVADKSREFQVRIGDITGWVVITDYALLDILGERSAPQQWGAVWHGPDPSHALSCRVYRPQEMRSRCRIQFSKARRTLVQSRRNPTEVVEGGMDVCSELEARVGRQGSLVTGQ